MERPFRKSFGFAPVVATIALAAIQIAFSAWGEAERGERSDKPGGDGPVYRSPFDAAFSPDGRELAVSDRTAGALVTIDARSGKVVREVRLAGEPTGVVWSADGRFVYVAERLAGSVAEIDRSGGIARRFRVKSRPVGLALAPGRNLLAVANSASHSVSLVDLTDGRERACVAVTRAPYYLAITPDERLVVVGNRLPAGDASDPRVSASVSLIDLESPSKATEIRLPPNASSVHGVAVSADGKWAYVAHNVGRTVIPTTLIEFGWINANALTIIDLAARKRFATILIDRRYEGAPNPWGVALAKDGETAWIALSGSHQLARLDLKRLWGAMRKQAAPIAAYQKSLEGEGEEITAIAASIYSDTAGDGDNPSSVELMVSDLPAAYAQGVYLEGVSSRVDLPGNGPRGLAISPDGTRLAVAMYYSGDIVFVDARKGETLETVALGKQPEPTEVRRGEMIFHDATYCYQQWLSCSTCHPDGRADGLNWDLMNDGVGTANNTRSLLWSHRTPPVMARGIRPSMEVAADAGFRFALFRPAKKEDLSAVQAYIRAMEPETSPFRIAGNLSEGAKIGKGVFESKRAECSRCHSGALFTNLRKYEVGTGAKWDRGEVSFDTPTLVELWRTAPYLHHGQAATLRDVLTRFNKNDRHGKTQHLSETELDVLTEYLKSL